MTSFKNNSFTDSLIFEYLDITQEEDLESAFICYGVKGRKGSAESFNRLENILNTGQIVASEPQKALSGDKPFVSTSRNLIGLLDPEGTYSAGIILDANRLRKQGFKLTKVNWHNVDGNLVQINKRTTSDVGSGGLRPIGIKFIKEYTNELAALGLDKNDPDYDKIMNDKIYIMKLAQNNTFYTISKQQFEYLKDFCKVFNQDITKENETKINRLNKDYLEYYEASYNIEESTEELSKMLVKKAGKDIKDNYYLTNVYGYNAQFGGPKISASTLGKYVGRVKFAQNIEDLDISTFLADLTSETNTHENESRVMLSSEESWTLDISQVVRLILLPKIYQSFNKEKTSKAMFDKFTLFLEFLKSKNLESRIFWYDYETTEAEIESAAKSRDNTTLTSCDIEAQQRLQNLIVQTSTKWFNSDERNKEFKKLDPNVESEMQIKQDYNKAFKDINKIYIELEPALNSVPNIFDYIKDSIKYAIFPVSKTISQPYNVEAAKWYSMGVLVKNPSKYYLKDLKEIHFKVSNGFKISLENSSDGTIFDEHNLEVSKVGDGLPWNEKTPYKYKVDFLVDEVYNLGKSDARIIKLKITHPKISRLN